MVIKCEQCGHLGFTKRLKNDSNILFQILSARQAMMSCYGLIYFHSELTSEYFGSVESILLTPMIICLTPRVKANRACSRVWPFFEIPASNSPVPAATISTAQSAWKRDKNSQLHSRIPTLTLTKADIFLWFYSRLHKSLSSQRFVHK